MKLLVTGIGKRNSGTSSKTGKNFDFTSIYGVCNHPDVIGQKAEEILFSHTSKLPFPEIQLGDTLFVSHNKNGFLDEIYVIEKVAQPPAQRNIKINNQSD